VTDSLRDVDPVRAVFREADEVIGDILEAHAAEGRKPSCLAGCSACCHQMVVATVAEARVALSEVQAWDRGVQEAFEQRLGDWLDRTVTIRRGFQEAAGGDLETEVEALAETYWRQRPACPFLVDRLCSIHPVRPLACRHHFSLSDPDLCATEDGGAIDQMEELDEALFEASDALPPDETEIGIFPELVAVLRG